MAIEVLSKKEIGMVSGAEDTASTQDALTCAASVLLALATDGTSVFAEVAAGANVVGACWNVWNSMSD